MEIKGVMGRLYVISEWIMRLAYVNLLWLLFSSAGLIFFGLFPATTAMFAIIRRWVIGDTDFAVFQTFWTRFRQDYGKAQWIGCLIVLLGLVLYLDYLFFAIGDGVLFLALRWVTVFLVFLYVSVFLFVFPVFVHYDLPLTQVFKSAFFIGALHPMQSLILITGHAVLLVVLWQFQGLLFFFGGSLPALWTMWIAHHVFRKITLKYKKKGEADAIEYADK